MQLGIQLFWSRTESASKLAPSPFYFIYILFWITAVSGPAYRHLDTSTIHWITLSIKVRQTGKIQLSTWSVVVSLQRHRMSSYPNLLPVKYIIFFSEVVTNDKDLVT